MHHKHAKSLQQTTYIQWQLVKQKIAWSCRSFFGVRYVRVTSHEPLCNYVSACELCLFCWASLLSRLLMGKGKYHLSMEDWAECFTNTHVWWGFARLRNPKLIAFVFAMGLVCTRPLMQGRGNQSINCDSQHPASFFAPCYKEHQRQYESSAAHCIIGVEWPAGDVWCLPMCSTTWG